MPVEIDALKPTSIFIAVSQSVNFTIGTYTHTHTRGTQLHTDGRTDRQTDMS